MRGGNGVQRLVARLRSWLRSYNKHYRALPGIVRNALIPTVFVGLVAAVRSEDAALGGGTAIVILACLAFLEKAHTAGTDAEFRTIELEREGYKAIHSKMDIWMRQRAERMAEALTEGNGDTKSILRKARGKLAFQRNMQGIVQALQSALHDYSLMKYGRSEDITIRVALLEPDGDRFRVQADPPSPAPGPSSHTDAGELDINDEELIATQAWNGPGGRPIVVSDTLAASNASPPRFKFLRDDQRKYLRSLVCYRVDDFGPEPERIGLICIDSDKPGFFPDEEQRPEEARFLRRLLGSAHAHIVHDARFENLVKHLDKELEIG